MKSLNQFIKESCDKDCEHKEVTIDLSGFDNAEDMIEELSELDNIEVDGQKIKVTVCKCDCEESKEALSKLKEYAKSLRESTRNASDEQFAQKTKKFKIQVDELEAYTQEDSNEEDPESQEEE